jgi:hypothetical protein
VVGESHYDEPDCEPCGPEATRQVVADYLAGTPVPFLDYLHKVSCGHRLALSREEFWQRVAFANFIQRAMETAAHRPTDKDWQDGLAPFWQTLDELQPDLVFMFTSAWRVLPSLAPGGIAERTGPVGEDGSWLWRYGRADHDVLIARFNHQRARGNPSVSVWQAWADHCWRALEMRHG